MELYPDKELPSFTRFIPLGKVEVEGEHFNDWSGHHFLPFIKRRVSGN